MFRRFPCALCGFYESNVENDCKILKSLNLRPRETRRIRILSEEKKTNKRWAYISSVIRLDGGFKFRSHFAILYGGRWFELSRARTSPAGFVGFIKNNYCLARYKRAVKKFSLFDGIHFQVSLVPIRKPAPQKKTNNYNGRRRDRFSRIFTIVVIFNAPTYHSKPITLGGGCVPV